MPKALYYPHTEIRSEIVLKNALLLWDSVETIVPHEQRLHGHSRVDGLIRDAAELIVQPRQPLTSERADAHKELAGLMESGQLHAILADAPSNWLNDRYSVYTDKFLHMTWHMLEREGLASFERDRNDYGVPPALGFLMMSLLADVCAGTQIRKITDRVDAYGWLAQAHAKALGTSPIVGFDVSQVAPSHDRLISISLEVLDARNIPLKRLIALREREQRGDGAGYAQMRRRYQATLDAHIQRVTREARNKTDVRELERQFRDEIRDDVVELKSELGAASLKTLFSKEVAISALVTAGTLVSPIAGLTALSTGIGAVGIIPLIKSAVDLRGERRAALKRHVSSWVYLATQPKVQLR